MRNDLISRQAVIDLLQKNMSNDIQDQIITENNINLICSIQTAYDVEKVVEELEKSRMIFFLTIANTRNDELDFSYKNVCTALDKAIDIVRKSGVE